MLSYIFSVCMCVIICVLNAKCQQDEGDACNTGNEYEGWLHGKCVNSRRCLATVVDIKNRIHPQICSYKGEEPIVCCYDCETEFVSDVSTVMADKYGYFYFKTGSKAVDKCVEYMLKLDYPCRMEGALMRELNLVIGDNCFTYTSKFENNANTTVGGVDARRGEYPHMALLGYGESLEAAEWVCGGSVISDRFILTAAHCMESSSRGSVKYIALGILKRSDPPQTWQQYGVRRSIPHPQYQAPSKYHDIALLETDKQIKFGPNVLPACLHTEGTKADNATATGWGALGHRNELADYLQVVILNEFSRDDCSKAFPPNSNLAYGYDHATQACYGDKQKPIDTCEGDSGGPLQVTTEKGWCVFRIVGITSFGRACGYVGTPGIYTRVAYYKPWIESVVWP